jgi:hypothetical protein
MARESRGWSRLASVLMAAVVLLGGASAGVVADKYLHRGRGVQSAAPGDEPLPEITGSPPPPRDGDIATTGRGPRPPAAGAWFGAYVQSDAQTVEGKAGATATFERQVDRQMAVVHVFHSWDEPFPSAYDRSVVDDGKVLLLSWEGTDTRSIVMGTYDDLIRQRAEAVRDLKVPVLLRFRWEMDRPNLSASVHSPADYIAAWKHVRGIFTDTGATNAGWVWCPLAPGFALNRAQAYYPGDDQVDWIGADVYPGRDYRSFGDLMTPVLAWARGHPRPVLIAEFGVRERSRGDRAAWLRGMQSYVQRQPQIKALVYFLVNHPTKPVYDLTFGGEPDALVALRAVVNAPLFAARPSLPR